MCLREMSTVPSKGQTQSAQQQLDRGLMQTQKRVLFTDFDIL